MKGAGGFTGERMVTGCQDGNEALHQDDSAHTSMALKLQHQVAVILKLHAGSCHEDTHAARIAGLRADDM